MNTEFASVDLPHSMDKMVLRVDMIEGLTRFSLLHGSEPTSEHWPWSNRGCPKETF